jgi:Txe/YoeB family toxin of Txe-Axe toxin-antitoxin module
MAIAGGLVLLWTVDSWQARRKGAHQKGPQRTGAEARFAGYWSRRITDEHRLVYKIAGDEVRIAACRYHYG